MCDYCVNHSAGKRWYLSARNYAKDLAFSEYVKGYATSYFSRNVQPKSFKPEEITNQNKEQIDQYYKMYLHHQVVSPKEASDILDLANKQTEGDDRTVVLLPCICRYSINGSDENLHCYGIAYTSDYTRKFPKYLGGKHQ